jgi:hypothetical protein
MSKSFFFLSAALVLGIAPRLGAQKAGGQAKVAIPAATAARMVGVEKIKTRTKGATLRKPSASQRGPDPSTLIPVVGPNGERRFARPTKQIK